MLPILKIVKYLKYPQAFSRGGDKQGYCFACGEYAEFKKLKVIVSSLAKAWKISHKIREAFDIRESMFCQNCQNTYRTRQLAKALVKVFGNQGEKSLKELINSFSFRSLNIAEINACGNLHPLLKDLPNLYYSEYQKYIKLKGVRDEDLQSLSYKDNFFDLILTSDTLEHVPTLEKALEAIYRVLKKGGYYFLLYQ